MSKRRSGKSTRVIFSALACDAENVIIVSPNCRMSKYLLEKFTHLVVNSPEFSYKVYKAELKIKAYDKTIWFIGEDLINDQLFYRGMNFDNWVTLYDLD